MKHRSSIWIAWALVAALLFLTGCAAETADNAAESGTAGTAEGSGIAEDTAPEDVSGTDGTDVSAEDGGTEDPGTTDSTESGCGEIEILEGSGDNTALTSGSVTVTIGNKTVTLSAAYLVDGVDAVISGGTWESSSTDENVFLVVNGGSLTITNARIVKAGDAGENDPDRTSDVSDDYNFYGINSVILAVGEGSTVTISDCVITSDASGANAVFSTDGAEVTAENVEITTEGNSSRGVYATYGGVIEGSHLTISTSGAHCAPIATDRGGGSVTVRDSVVSCSGDGSPCIYSTGEITVERVTGTSTGAQAAVIEGKNSVTMTDCVFTVTGSGNNGVMLYQSMSGDAADSDATTSVSTLTMRGTALTVENGGPVFYVTNTSSQIILEGGNEISCSSGTLLSAGAGRWGSDGSNGGQVTVTVSGDVLEGDVEADDTSSVSIALSGEASLDGDISGNVTVN